MPDTAADSIKLMKDALSHTALSAMARAHARRANLEQVAGAERAELEAMYVRARDAASRRLSGLASEVLWIRATKGDQEAIQDIAAAWGQHLEWDGFSPEHDSGDEKEVAKQQRRLPRLYTGLEGDFDISDKDLARVAHTLSLQVGQGKRRLPPLMTEIEAGSPEAKLRAAELSGMYRARGRQDALRAKGVSSRVRNLIGWQLQKEKAMDGDIPEVAKAFKDRQSLKGADIDELAKIMDVVSSWPVEGSGAKKLGTDLEVELTRRALFIGRPPMAPDLSEALSRHRTAPKSVSPQELVSAATLLAHHTDQGRIDALAAAAENPAVLEELRTRMTQQLAADAQKLRDLPHRAREQGWSPAQILARTAYITQSWASVTSEHLPDMPDSPERPGELLAQVGRFCEAVEAGAKEQRIELYTPDLSTAGYEAA